VGANAQTPSMVKAEVSRDGKVYRMAFAKGNDRQTHVIGKSKKKDNRNTHHVFA
jgi:DNA gyrase/topoisomerase IV subunit B